MTEVCKFVGILILLIHNFVDTIVPFKTRTYADGGNAAEGGGVPMCTLRNFPHLTDHCIEWSRDQFELLFVKLPKSLENYLNDPALFEQKIREKAASEAGAAFFDIRSVTSFANLVANPSIGNAAQLAFDLFHFLFRDRILDLQAAFPLDSRVIDKNTGIDKGPFWGEKKRYPTVATFNPNDEVHTEFILSCTCLFSVMVGLIPPKDENDSEWLQEYRSSDWVVQMVSNLSPPAYVQAPVTSADLDDAPEMDKSILEGMLQNMCNDLKQLADKIQKLPNFELADFEKDDDMNFHIAFTTATANLRCDNYSIKRTDFHSCKIIAGKIIAAIATTTAAVCGLVLFELFKVILEKDTDAFMNRAIGLAGFTYTSFTQEPPYKFSTRTELEVPNPTDPLPDDAYDHTGKLKDEYITKIVKRAYPEGHSVWNKIICQASMTLKQFQEWLADEHKLKLQSWDFIYGKKSVTDESKEKRTQGVSTPIFPPKPKLDYSLLPSLDLTLAQATMAIMKVPAAKPTQQYLALWKQCKQDGIIPDGPQDSDNAITMDTTLKEILLKMAKMGEEATKKQLIDTATVSSLDGKLFYLIHGSESPICCDIDTEEAVENLCSIKIML